MAGRMAVATASRRPSGEFQELDEKRAFGDYGSSSQRVAAVAGREHNEPVPPPRRHLQ